MEWSGTIRQEKRNIFFVPYLTRPHCFRHTFATRCFEAGIQPKTVQKYLGHATLQMTMDLYTHVLEHHLSDEMDKLEDRMDTIELLGDNIAEERYKKEFLLSTKSINIG